jgi:hypothetical protein
MTVDAGDHDGVALTRYGILMSYLAYENNMFWQRAGFFLLASSALVAFSAQSLLKLVATDAGTLVLPLGAAAFGLALARLWYRTLAAAEKWIEHWHRLLKALESQAFADMSVFDDPRLDRSTSLKAMAYHVIRLFVVFWIASAAYAVVLVTAG